MSNRRRVRRDETQELEELEVNGVTFKITRKLQREARRNGWSGGQMMAVAMQRAMPDAQNIEIHIPANPDAEDSTLRGGYVASVNGHYPAREYVDES